MTVERSRGLLAGRICIVTGAGSGLGAATARLFADEGADVVAVDREFGRAKAKGSRIETISADVCEAEPLTQLASRLNEVHVVATFAGISFGGRLDETTDTTWHQVLAVNLLATANWIAAFLPHLRRTGSGSVITLGSQLAIAGGRGNASYIASKGAIHSLTRCLALDYAADNIRVNCIVPGAIETPLLERALARASDPAAARANSLSRHPLGRFGTPEEVARAALYLASDQSSFTTGTLMPVDGGWLAA